MEEAGGRDAGTRNEKSGQLRVPVSDEMAGKPSSVTEIP